MKSKDNYKVIGVMSGTSLDGMDIACCKFSFRKKWKFEILDAITLPYSTAWKKKLNSAHHLSGAELMALDAEYGSLIGENCNSFIASNKLKKIDGIASHGHTIFHQIQKGFTFQLGNGNSIHAATDIPVIYDFRSLDVALKGQGAPLVPAGDHHLFSRYDICLNFGGIANLSMEKKGKRIAFDICFVNMGLNYLATKAGKAFDKNGDIASKGFVIESLLEDLKKVYDEIRDKRPSLGREGFEKGIQPFLDDELISLPDRMRTFCESIGDEIAAAIPQGKLTILATGGGAFNSFLIQTIQQKIRKSEIVLPSKKIIEFKEALVFAFLGVLRMRGEINIFKSATRARANSCSGVFVG